MKIEKGQIVEGTVTGIKPYGAFIELDNGPVGLAFIEDLSVVRIKSPEERVQVGQKVKCMVKSVNEENGKINLSYKDCLGTWEENAQKFKEGMTVKGIVRNTEKNNNGIFIELYKRIRIWSNSGCLHKKDCTREKESKISYSLNKL